VTPWSWAAFGRSASAMSTSFSEVSSRTPQRSSPSASATLTASPTESLWKSTRQMMFERAAKRFA
jgi:hypothetical protein